MKGLKRMVSITAVANRVGINPRELKRFIKFGVVGVIGAVVDFGTFNLLLNPMRALFAQGAANSVLQILHQSADQMAVTTCAAISFMLAILSNFTWNRLWTYRDSRSKSLRRQFAQFFLVNTSGILFRVPIVTIATIPFTRLMQQFPLVPISPERLGPNLAVALSVGIVMFWNFFANRYWTYNDVQ
jgi:putative flippase GtrA